MPAAAAPAAMVATWNNVATTFTGLKLNVTDTASAAGSLLMDLQVGGASKFTLSKAGMATFGGGITTGGTITAGASSRIGWAGVSQIYGGGTNGNIVLSNSAATDFGLLQFGGYTSSFPALKRSGTGIQVRLADDSGYSGLSASNVTASNGGFYSGYGTYLSDMSDGVARLSNYGVTGFTRLILGTNDASGIAIKKNGTSFSFVLGDDSGYSELSSSNVTAHYGGFYSGYGTYL